MVTISFAINAPTPAEGAETFLAILNDPRQLQEQLAGINSKLDSIQSEVIQIMATAQEIKDEVTRLTTEVAENNTLLDTLERGNKDKDALIQTLNDKITALDLDKADADALRASLDDIKASIKADADALDARQPHEPPPEPPA